MIKCTNIQEQVRDISQPLMKQIFETVGRGNFIFGEEVDIFERWMSKRCNGAEAISLNSGTDALILALKALNIGPDDEVITSANTFIATVGAIVSVGAIPVLADVNDNELLSLATISSRITDRTKAVIPVHLRGRPVDMPPIVTACKKLGISVIEDCAQAIGTTINGVQVGIFGDAGAFSLHPLKTLGCFGDGGVLVTTQPTIAAYAKSVRTHGLGSRNTAAEFGANSRLDSLQAAVLNIKTNYIDSWLARRKKIANYYNDQLRFTSTGVDLGNGMLGNSYYHYVVQSKRRDQLVDHLKSNNIEAMVHYPIPIHEQPAWTKSQPSIALPNTECLARQILTIPCHQHLSDAEIEHVVSSIKRFDTKS